MARVGAGVGTWGGGVPLPYLHTCSLAHPLTLTHSLTQHWTVALAPCWTVALAEGLWLWWLWLSVALSGPGSLFCALAFYVRVLCVLILRSVPWRCALALAFNTLALPQGSYSTLAIFKNLNFEVFQ
jgi:hypothetical protein